MANRTQTETGSQQGAQGTTKSTNLEYHTDQRNDPQYGARKDADTHSLQEDQRHVNAINNALDNKDEKLPSDPLDPALKDV
jgi:hypothetical protein